MEKEDNAKLLDEVRRTHEKFSPDDVVWDIEDLSEQPPWATNIDFSVTSLANFFCNKQCS
ncbi:Imm70 family immunity protein [Paenibacillus sp. 2TAB23]|uniref:Imm70 family immunity protein n=1 Tax=Paenibacillus sp. 2TAB23 TaxID=3233004 RepID=UPI003F9612B6